MRHMGALLGITVLVFGTIFLFTSDWPLGGLTGETAAVSEAEAPADEAAAPAEGEAAPADEAPAQAAEAIPVSEELLAQGETIYAQCQACHGPAGEGSVGPAFAGNANLEDAAYVAETIVHGREAMPAFGDRFDDTEIAAVGTFIRNSWDNAFGGMTPEDVAAARETAPAE